MYPVSAVVRLGRDVTARLANGEWAMACPSSAVRCNDSRATSLSLQPCDHLREDEASASTNEHTGHAFGLEVVNRPEAAIELSRQPLSPEQTSWFRMIARG